MVKSIGNLIRELVPRTPADDSHYLLQSRSSCYGFHSSSLHARSECSTPARREHRCHTWGAGDSWWLLSQQRRVQWRCSRRPRPADQMEESARKEERHQLINRKTNSRTISQGAQAPAPVLYTTGAAASIWFEIWPWIRVCALAWPNF